MIFLCSLAAIFAGGLSCGLYTTNSPMTTKYICHQAPLDLLVLQDIQMLEKMLEIEPEIDQLVKKFILMDPLQTNTVGCSENVITWQDMLKSGQKVGDDILTDIEKKQAVNQVCMLQYTSGTTGPPKGMINKN